VHRTDGCRGTRERARMEANDLSAGWRMHKMLFGCSSEKRGSAKQQAEKAPQSGHGPREQKELGVVEGVHELDVADRVCTSCGEPLTEMSGQFEESDEIDALARQFVLVRHKRKKYR
jgi:transposase